MRSVAALLILIFAGCEAPPLEYDGSWSGRSERGGSIDFVVTRGAIHDLKIGVGNMRCTGTLTWSGPTVIREKQVQVDEKSLGQFGAGSFLKFSGAFASDHAASGEVHASASRGLADPGCSGDASGKWWATRDAWKIAETEQMKKIFDAINANDFAGAQRLIAAVKPENANALGDRPLDVAVAKGDLPTIRALLRKGAPADGADYSYPPIRSAARSGNAGVVRELVNSGASERVRRLALLAACESGSLDVVRLLVEDAKTGVNSAENYDGLIRTPLILAVEGNHAGVVKYLLDHGADPKAEDGEHLTALDHARAKHASAVLKVLGQ